MRTELEMMNLIMSFAINDDRIRVVGMEGSRTNINIKKDNFQDYDIAYIVSDIESFKQNDEWLNYFGNRIIMQKPEAMTLFEPELGNWFTYLMLFNDGNRIDLTLVPLNELELYLNSDKLIKISLDKDNRVSTYPIPTDIDYHVKKPNELMYDDCCNEFWWVSTYVAKGLCRNEILYAIDHLNNNVRKCFLIMMSWLVGIKTDFSISVGKNFKFINKYISNELWSMLLQTYKMTTIEEVWNSLFLTQKLFRDVSNQVAQHFGFKYLDYDKNITNYINNLYIKYYENTTKEFI